MIVRLNGRLADPLAWSVIERAIPGESAGHLIDDRSVLHDKFDNLIGAREIQHATDEERQTSVGEQGRE